MAKGGLTGSLASLGLCRGDAERVWFCDELRAGLISQLRRRWCPRGVRLVQKQQMRFVWRWLCLAVNPLTGRLLWRWQQDLRTPAVAESASWLGGQGVAALVWDNAPAHRAKVVKAAEASPPLCFLPPFSPELNPAERVFAEVRRHIEGRPYESLDEKVRAAEAFLSGLSGDPERVRRLAGWRWVREALAALPPAPQSQPARPPEDVAPSE